MNRDLGNVSPDEQEVTIDQSDEQQNKINVLRKSPKTNDSPQVNLPEVDKSPKKKEKLVKLVYQKKSKERQVVKSKLSPQ